MIKLVAPEKKRIYVNVTHVKISDSGNHRLDTGDGWKHIVVPGWVAIDLEMDEWTF